MRTLLKSFGFLIACVLAPSLVQAQDTFQIFAGYSYVRGSIPITETILCPGPPCPTTTTTYHSNLNGWEISGTYKPWHWLGLTADYSGHYGTTQGATTHLQTFLFGPQVSLPGRVSPFAHVLVGGAYESAGIGFSSGLTIPIPTSGASFAAAVGGGIDVRVAPFLSIRPVQVDYLLTRPNSTTESQPRVSAGVVFRF